ASISAIVSDPPDGTVATVGAALVLAGAFTKSAQAPFHFWLPGAMAAPTPVSAYLHSATMVKAGIVLVARLAPGLAPLGPWRGLIAAAGVTSLLLGGLRAMRQYDAKLLLAHGTVSQLGFLMVLVGAGDPGLTAAGVAMLLTHALFKAALFLVVGIVDHSAHSRDLRALTGLGRRLPLLAALAGLAAASMAGIPPLLGFAAKEMALDEVLHADLGARRRGPGDRPRRRRPALAGLRGAGRGAGRRQPPRRVARVHRGRLAGSRGEQPGPRCGRGPPGPVGRRARPAAHLGRHPR